jgi:hypothetical protein
MAIVRFVGEQRLFNSLPSTLVVRFSLSVLYYFHSFVLLMALVFLASLLVAPIFAGAFN